MLKCIDQPQREFNKTLGACAVCLRDIYELQCLVWDLNIVLM